MPSLSACIPSRPSTRTMRALSLHFRAKRNPKKSGTQTAVSFVMKFAKYRVLQLPFLAFFSKRLYRDIGLNWKGANLAYLFLLLAICSVPTALHYRDSIIKGLESNEVTILNQIPEIQIKNGIAHVDVKMPYYIKNTSGQPVAIIDTTGSMNYIDDPSVQVMMTETKLIVRRGRTLFNKFDLSAVDELYIDKHVINGWIGKVREAIAPLSYGIFLLLTYIFAVMVMILVAVVGLIISNITHSALGFKDTMRIAITASTPSIIGITICSVFGVTVSGYFHIAVTLCYLLLGIIACSTKVKESPSGKIDLKAALSPDLKAALDEAA